MIQYICTYVMAAIIFIAPVSASEMRLTSFDDIPLNIKVKIFAESEPTKALSLSRELRRGMQNTYIWAKSDLVLTGFLGESVDEAGTVIEDSRLMQALKSPTDGILIRRLLFLSAATEEEGVKKQIRHVLTARIAPNPFYYTDKMIDFSRKTNVGQGVIIKLARADFAHGSPMIHSGLLPVKYKPYFSSAILELTQSQADGTYRIWRFTGHPNQAMLATVSHKHGEEYPLFNGFMIDGHLVLEDKQILYKDMQRKNWPVLE